MSEEKNYYEKVVDTARETTVEAREHAQPMIDAQIAVFVQMLGDEATNVLTDASYIAGVLNGLHTATVCMSMDEANLGARECPDNDDSCEPHAMIDGSIAYTYIQVAAASLLQGHDAYLELATLEGGE